MRIVCKKCNIEKDISEYHKHKKGKYGVRCYCKECRKKETRLDRKEYLKDYYKKNKEKILKNVSIYHKNNKSSINLYKVKRRESDKSYKLYYTISSKIRKSLKFKGFYKKNKTLEIIGCSSYDEFRRYLESKFEHWMSWDNYGKYNGEFNYGWDIDHIIPISSALREDEILKLNHYSNLQPLCSKINRDIKRDRI